MPSCFRSEGFAEDLHEAEPTNSGGNSASNSASKSSRSGGVNGNLPVRRQWVARGAESLRGVMPIWRRPGAL
jgi:hypothetical protein